MYRAIAQLLPVFLASASLAVEVRVASFNIENGLGTPGTTGYDAARDVLIRTDADIVGFQELSSGGSSNLVVLGQDLGYAYTAFTSSTSFDSSRRNGFLSRYPILSADLIRSPSGANEMTRSPLLIEVEVPGALYPLTVVSVHSKSGGSQTDEFRRAIEAQRIVEHVQAWTVLNGTNAPLLVVGDLNDDPALSQTLEFSTLPTGLPGSYDLGSDVSFPVPYRFYPHDRFDPADLTPLLLYQEDTLDLATHHSGYQIDFLMVNPAVGANATRLPIGEVYNSIHDDGFGGMPKAGSLLPSGTSDDASDHLLLFADIYLEDAMPCYAPGILISEVVDDPTSGVRFVELHNPGAAPISLDTFFLDRFDDGQTTSSVSLALSGSLVGGDSVVIANDTALFQTRFGALPDFQSAEISGDGNDVYRLTGLNDTPIDIYGVIGEATGPADFSTTWSYSSQSVARVVDITQPNRVWTASEWMIGPASTTADPGLHTSCLTGAVTHISLAVDPSQPDAGTPFHGQVQVLTNRLVTSVSPVFEYRVDGGTWQSESMTLQTNGLWRTATAVPGQSAGAEIEFRVATSFTGGGGGMVESPSRVVEIPNPPLVEVWINEIDYDQASTDSNEWVELAGPAGLSLDDYELVFLNQSGTPYGTYELATAGFTFADEGDGFGFFVMGRVEAAAGVQADYEPAGWTANKIQNGGTDSVLLRHLTTGEPVHLVDYEGNNSNTQEDQATFLSDNSSALTSLFLSETGQEFSDFTWTNTSGQSTPGGPNDGQWFTPLDSDLDGMPDFWEVTHFGGATNGVSGVDGDGDGFSNLQEYLADTLPGSELSYFEISAFEKPSGSMIGVDSSADRVYLLEYSDDLTLPDGGWQPAGAVVAGTGNWLPLVDWTSGTSRVYRVSVGP